MPLLGQKIMSSIRKQPARIYKKKNAELCMSGSEKGGKAMFWVTVWLLWTSKKIRQSQAAIGSNRRMAVIGKGINIFN